MEWALSWGYLGAFIISIAGNLIPFFPIPYLAAVFLLASNYGLDPLLLGIISGVGGGVGKLITYFIGRGASKIVYREEDEKLEAFKKLLGNYGALAAFIIAATPSPDDIVILVLGIIRYSITKFFIAITLGKIALSLIVAYFGRAYFEIMKILGGGEEFNIVMFVASLVLMAVIWYIISKVDWVKLMKEVEEKGWKEVAKSYLIRRRED